MYVPLGRIPVGTCRIERGEAKKAKKTRGTAGIEPTTSRTRSAVIPFLSRMNHATRPCSPALASAGRDDSKKSVSSEYTMKKTRDPGFDPLISRFDVQLRSKICWRIRNTAKTKQGSSQPHLAKPAAKTSTITEKNAKNAWQPKCSKSERARSPDSAAPGGTARGKPAYATGAFLALAPALVRRRPRRTSRRAKRTSPQPSRRCRGTTVLNSLREAAHVKKPPRTKNNCSSAPLRAGVVATGWARLR